MSITCTMAFQDAPDKSVATVARRWKNAAILHALASVATVKSTFVGRVFQGRRGALCNPDSTALEGHRTPHQRVFPRKPTYNEFLYVE